MEITLRDLTPEDVPWLVAQHSALYARDDGFDESFGALVAESLDTYLRERDSSCERAWIAEQGGERLGSIFCVRQDAQTARLRLFFLLPKARGQGLGRWMLGACMRYARARGYGRMVLATHESHVAACGLYAATGWTLMNRKPVHSFGVDLVEQAWEIAL